MLLTSCKATEVEYEKFPCPSLVEYSKDFKQELKDELKLLGSSSKSEEVLRDYLELREQVRLCK